MNETHTKTTDDLLPMLAAVARGDQRAFADLYDRTSSTVYGLARRILRDPADAEETAFDVYAQVWRSAGSYNPTRGSVIAWMVMLARSRALDRVRARASRRPRGVVLTMPDAAACPDAPPPEQAAFESEFRVRAHAALATLPASQRQLIELAFFEGRTHRELAGDLGLPLGTVKTRVRQGLLRLREVLAEYEPRSLREREDRIALGA